jgi:nitrogen regulatory protein PII
MFLVLAVIDDCEKVNELLDAWEEIGVSGVTILHSSGLGRVRQNKGWRDDLPLFPSLEALLQHEEFFSRTLFTVVNDDALIDKLVDSTQRIIGDLSQPNTGLLVVLPAAQVYGIPKQGQ